MADNASVIAQFLKSKGLPPAAIAGIIGNFMTESSLNPNAINQREQAIGLGQWEGGRRTALQQYAAAHGLRENDIQAQLGYMWQELSTGYSGVLQQLRNATDPGQAAAVWDAQYEVSSGSSRGQRIANAQSYFKTGSTSGEGAGVESGSAEDLSAGAGGTTNPTAADYRTALGADLQGLFTSVPELTALLNNAIATDQPVNDFINSVQNSKWYKTHSDTVRQQIALKASDPATYAANLAAAQDQIMTESYQLGVTLTAAQAKAFASQSLLQNWTTADIQRAIGHDYKGGGSAGQAASYDQQLKQLASQYGQTWSQATVDYRTAQLLSGYTTLDTYRELAIKQAKSTYPSLSGQLDSGLTVADLADPYKQQMASLLEVDPNTINATTDPSIRKALQGTMTTTGSTTTATATPLWQFENTVRADPRWQKTDNAKASAYSLLHNLGQQFGFST